MLGRYLRRGALAAAILIALASGTARAQSAFVTDYSNSAVSQIDLVSGNVVATIGVGALPLGVAVTPDGRTAYVASLGLGTVSVIDAASHKVTTTIAVSATAVVWGLALAPDGSAVYVAVQGSSATSDGSVAVISTASNTVTGQVAVGVGPVYLAVSPDGSRVYVANQSDKTVSVLDTASRKIVATIGVGSSPTGIAVTPDGSTVYVADQAGNTISVIDTGTGIRTTKIPVGQAPYGVAFSPDGAKAYVTNSTDGTVSVIDVASGSVTATIKVGAGPFGIAVTPDGSRAYVGNIGSAGTAQPFSGQAVSVIDLASDTVIGTITAGLGAADIAIGAPPVLLSSILPSGRSVAAGATATVFATMLNTGAGPLADCRIGLAGSAPAGLAMSFQATDPQTNAPIGSPNTPVTIPGNDGTQTFLLAFHAADALSVSEQPLAFVCLGALPVAAIQGVNTIDLRFSTQPTPDIVALSATASGNGIVTIPQSTGGAAAFAVATVNVGTAGSVTVSTDAASPVTATLCQSDPTTAACLAPPTASVNVDFTAGATPTFSVFLTASAPLALDPAKNRLAVTFADAAGDVLTRTSVAVDTD